MNSKPTTDGKRVRLSTQQRLKMREEAKRRGSKNFKRGLTMSKLLDQMWGK